MIEKVKDLLSSKDRWTKNAIARDKNDEVVYEDDKNAVKFCLMGALLKIYGYNCQLQIRKIEDIIRLNFDNNNYDLVDFNNSPLTSFSDIQKVLELADV